MPTVLYYADGVQVLALPRCLVPPCTVSFSSLLVFLKKGTSVTTPATFHVSSVFPGAILDYGMVSFIFKSVDVI